jgi:hypothetical protein
MIITSSTYSRLPYQKLSQFKKEVFKNKEVKKVFKNPDKFKKKIERLINVEKTAALITELKEVSSPDQLKKVFYTIFDKENFNNLIKNKQFSTKKNQPLSTKTALRLLIWQPEMFFEIIGNLHAEELAEYITHEKRRMKKKY